MSAVVLGQLVSQNFERHRMRREKSRVEFALAERAVQRGDRVDIGRSELSQRHGRAIPKGALVDTVHDSVGRHMATPLM